MGSFCKSGPATSTTNSTSTTTPTGLAQLNDIWNRVSSAASTPYTPYSGQLVAGLTPTQQGGISNITNATSYLDTAKNFANQGAQNISPDQISQYYNPFLKDVIGATQAQFNEQNAQADERLKGNSIARGAWGGDRADIGRAALAGQQQIAQAPVIAGLNQQGFNLALAAAQQDRAAKAQAGYQYGALGNAALAQGQSQIGAGSLEQGTNQAGLNAAYQQFLQQQAFPYQQAQFLASTGLPAVTAMGGTTTGQSQTQQYAAQPSPLSQIIGAGTAIAGLASGNPFAARGGASSLFGGGGLSNIGGFGIPGMGASQSAMGGGFGGGIFAKRGGRINRPKFTDGGFIDQVNSIRQALRNGGPVIDMSRRADGIYVPMGYADGGDVTPFDAIDSRFPMAGEINAGADALANPMATRDALLGYGRGIADVPQSALPVRPVATTSYVPPPAAPVAPIASTPVSLPPQITNPGGGGAPITLPDEASAYSGDVGGGGLRAPDAPIANVPIDRGSGKPLPGFNPLGLTEEGRLGLIAAGLGMLSSKSPNAFGAIGEGGLQGLKTYTQAKDIRAKQDLDARKLMQQAEQFAQGLDIRQQTLEESRRYHDIVSQDRRDALIERERAARERAQDRRDALAEKAREANEKREAGKPLPSGGIKSLSDAGAAYADFTRLSDTWKPEFGGKTAGLIGDTQNLIGRNVGMGYEEQANWWQDYQTQKNMARHSLFGSALTATEKAEFDKANINPGMTADVIEKNLARQKNAAERAARKLATAYRKSGYNADAVEAAVGVPFEAIGAGESRGVAPALPAPTKSAAGAPRTAPPEAVAKLKANPQLAPDFDAKYGPGAAKRALGE